MNQEQTHSSSLFQQPPEPLAVVPEAGEAQKVCASPRESETADAVVLGYN
ncbi:MAG TPA: hypothetical protein VFW68_01580 [Rhodocyclaceae bacterium]|nr:hypothetical protein [Rhodocyclaceae bacterium]